MRLVLALCVVQIIVLSVAEPLQDSCECECCYGVEKGHGTCISKEMTTFQSHTCTNCNVSTCVEKFPIQCGGKGASVFADCIERTAWYLRIFPIIFVIATFALLIYGFFFKTFDGYNPIREDSDHNSTQVSLSVTPYASVGYSPFEPRHPYAVRRPSPLSQAVPLQSGFVSPLTPKVMSPAQYLQRNSIAESMPLAYQPTQYGGLRGTEPISPRSARINLPLKLSSVPQPQQVVPALGTEVHVLDATEQTSLDPIPESTVSEDEMVNDDDDMANDSSQAVVSDASEASTQHPSVMNGKGT